MSSEVGIYFDGVTSARRDVAVALARSSLRISAQDGRLLTEWPYDEIEGLAAPDKSLQIRPEPPKLMRKRDGMR